jgi:hypothetical protein
VDYFQGVVTDYLRADRAMFINTECCIQLNPGANPDKSGPHWFCDVVAVNLRESEVFLCEVTYSQSLGALSKRLQSWSANWPLLRAALTRDCAVHTDWPVRPWLFIPHDLRGHLEKQLARIPNMGSSPAHMPQPMVTDLEDVTPWKYNSWNRVAEMADDDD